MRQRRIIKIGIIIFICFGCILLVIGNYYQQSIKLTHPFPNTSVPEIIYVVVADSLDRQGSLCELFHSVVWHDWPLMYVLGWDDKKGQVNSYNRLLRKESAQFHTFMLGSKLTLLNKFLSSSIATTVVVLTDAYDIILQESYETFLHKYHHQLGSPKALFSTENDCWPPSFHHLYPTETKNNNNNFMYQHLNSGGFVGDVLTLKTILQAAIRDDNPEYYRHHLYFTLDNDHVVSEGERDMIYDNVTDPDEVVVSNHYYYRVPGVYKRNDQIIFSLLYFTGMYNITLDHHAYLWQSMQLSRENHQKHIGMRLYPTTTTEADDSTMRLQNLLTDTFPTFIHFNGPSKSLDDSFTPYNFPQLRNNLWYKKRVYSKQKDRIFQEMDKRIIILDRMMNRVKFDFRDNCP